MVVEMEKADYYDYVPPTHIPNSKPQTLEFPDGNDLREWKVASRHPYIVEQ